MIYFTADLHLGHENVIKMCNRPFSSTEEMNNTLIKRWNKKVGNSDTVYIVGDMMWKDAPYIDILSSLKGHKILIAGNHDSIITNNQDAISFFDDIAKYIEVSLDNHPITMCHYPMLEWKNSRKEGSTRLGYLIYGHVHNRCDTPEYQMLMSHPNALNAGVDINNFEPCSFQELYENNMKFKRENLSSEMLALLNEREENLTK